MVRGRTGEAARERLPGIIEAVQAAGPSLPPPADVLGQLLGPSGQVAPSEVVDLTRSSDSGGQAGPSSPHARAEVGGVGQSGLFWKDASLWAGYDPALLDQMPVHTLEDLMAGLPQGQPPSAAQVNPGGPPGSQEHVEHAVGGWGGGENRMLLMAVVVERAVGGQRVGVGRRLWKSYLAWTGISCGKGSRASPRRRTVAW